MAFPFRSLSWALVTIVCTAALLYSIARPEAAAPILGVVLFALYVGLLCEAILDVTMRPDLRMAQRLAWIGLCLFLLPLVPVMAGVYFLLGRRRSAELLAREDGPEEGADGGGAARGALRRVAHRPYSVRAGAARALRLRMSR